MKISNYFFTLAFATLGLAACTENDSMEQGFASGREIQVETSLTKTRAGIANANEIGTFMLRISDAVKPRYDYYAVMERVDAKWQSFALKDDDTKGEAMQMLWGDNEQPINVAAFYSPNGLVNEVSFMNPNITIAENQSTPDLVKSVDYLYMSPKQFTYGDDGKVNVVFNHLMSKLYLTVTLAPEFNTIPGTVTNPISEIKVWGTNKQGVYNTYANRWTYASSNSAEITPCLSAYTAGSGKTQKATAVYECLLVPDQISSGRFGIKITVNGNEYTWSCPTEVQFESNCSYRLPVIVGKDYVTVGDVMVSDWENGGNLPDGETTLDAWDGSIASVLSGAGTKEDPYLISNGAELAYVAQEINSGRTTFMGYKYFELTQNIDLANKPWTPIGFGEPKFDADGNLEATEGKMLNAVFDGKGYTIYNLNIDESGKGVSAGFFGWYCGEIKNLTIRKANVKSDYLAGILIGETNGSSSINPVITNCHVSGTVSSNKGNSLGTGGMVGSSSYLTMEDCSADVEVNGSGMIGGLVGNAFESKMVRCSVRGTVNGAWSVGGFAGILYYNSNAEECTSYAKVNANDWHCGGFVGYLEMNSVVKNCSVEGDVTSTCTVPRAGGFVGGVNDAQMEGCSFKGKLTAEKGDPKGAFIGRDGGNTKTTSCSYDATKNAGLNAIGADDSGSTSSHDIVAK